LNYKLIVFDLDGTLLSADFILSEQTLAAIEELRALGLRVSVATGRSYKSAKPFLDRMGIVEPMVFSNGCVFDNPETGERELIAGVPLESALIALMLKDEYGLSIKCHMADGRILKSDDRPWKDEGVHFEVGEIRPNLKAELDEDPIKMVFVGDAQRLKDFKARMEEIMGTRAQARIFQSHASYLEMANYKVSKGDALLMLVEKLGILAKEVITVGDQENDYEMLKYFGWGVMAGPGHERLKEVAQDWIQSPEEGGIVELVDLVKKRLSPTT